MKERKKRQFLSEERKRQREQDKNLDFSNLCLQGDKKYRKYTILNIKNYKFIDLLKAKVNSMPKTIYNAETNLLRCISKVIIGLDI